MTASSEFILAPRIDEQKMRKEAEKMEVELQRTSRQAADDFEYWFGKGFEDGADKGIRGVKRKLTDLQAFLKKMGFDSMSKGVGDVIATPAKGAIAAAAAALGVSLAAEKKILEDPVGYAQIARERINDNSELSDNADALGIDRGRYAALSSAGIAARLDQSDIRGIMSGFIGALERPEMALYKKAAEEKGVENSFLDFVGTMAKMKPEIAAQYMNQTFGDEDALKVSRFMKPFQKIIKNGGDLTLQTVVDTMLGRHVRTQEMGDALNRNDKAANTLARGASDQFEDKVINGPNVAQAETVVASDKSSEAVTQKHLEVLDLKVKGQVIADKAEIAVISGGEAVVRDVSTYSEGASRRWRELVDAGNLPINKLDSWKQFGQKTWDFGTYNPVTAATGKNAWRHMLDFFDAKGAEINQTMISIVEQDAENNKNRGDTGAKAMK
ncbi:MAG: hypothetical protein ACK5MF_06340 [Vibrio sp.]|uniref:hypothetical protein n=1 Tax=Vibrio sp. TaxID=678 RepID=UPI003A866F70